MGTITCLEYKRVVHVNGISYCTTSQLCAYMMLDPGKNYLAGRVSWKPLPTESGRSKTMMESGYI